MKRMFTAVYEQCEEWIAARVLELPGANTQGKTLDEARANLTEAVTMILAERCKLRETEGAKLLLREELSIDI